MLAELGAQTQDDLERYMRAAKRQARPKSRRQVQGGLSNTSVLSVRDANRRIDNRRADEVSKQWRRMEREGKKAAQRATQRENTVQSLSREESAAITEQGNDLFFIDTNGWRR